MLGPAGTGGGRAQMLLAIELVRGLEVQGFGRAEDGGPGCGAQAALELGAEDDAALPAAEGCF